MQYSMIVLLHVVLLPALLWSQPFQEAIRQPSADNLIRRSVGQIRVPPRLVFAQDGGHSQDFIDIHFKDAVKRRNFEARYDGYEVRMDRAALAIAPDGSVLIAPITEPTGATQEFAISINKGGVLLSLQLVLELDPETGILTKGSRKNKLDI